MDYSKLTPKIVLSAKPQDKIYKLWDGRGLYLKIMPNGSKYWRLKFRYNGKEQTLSFGCYPEVSLKEARIKCLEARYIIHHGNDPRHKLKENEK